MFDRWSAVFVFHATDRIGSRIEALVCAVMCFVGSLGLVVKDEPMTARITQVCPKTESTVFKVWVIVCGVDSLCRLVAFRFCQLDGNSRHKILECVLAASVGVTSFFAVLSCVFAWTRTLEFVEARCRCIVALFLGMQHLVR